MSNLPLLPKNPSLYQINTRILLQELSTHINTRATLSDITDRYLDNIAALGFDYVWFLGVWQTGPTSMSVSRSKEDWRNFMKQELPDLIDDDITGSPYAIVSYSLNSDFGTENDLRDLRKRLNSRGVRLILDFVPNHVGIDHEWAHTHPEYLIQGSFEDLQTNSSNYIKLGDKVFAYGRDPNYDGWSDTLQLNYRHQGLRQAMMDTLLNIASFCDGLRCDMAMLLLPSVFIEKTWGDKSLPSDGSPPVDTSFWLDIIPVLLQTYPTFTLMAEVYWDMEWELQQQGFRYTYDKRLYDRLLSREVRGVYLHLMADPEFMAKSVRFLENHDEKRAAHAFSSEDQHMATALITYCVPGLKFFGEGQLEGFKSHVSMHIGRRRSEEINQNILEFYSKILAILKLPPVLNGNFTLLGMEQAWDGNPTHDNFICFILYHEGSLLLVTVNYAEHQSQCYVKFNGSLDQGNLSENVTLKDMMGTALYERNRDEMKSKGLYLDMPGWGYHLFQFISS